MDKAVQHVVNMHDREFREFGLNVMIHLEHYNDGVNDLKLKCIALACSADVGMKMFRVTCPRGRHTSWRACLGGSRE